MIQVLQNWQTVETATEALKNQGLPTHITIQKNWDQWLLQQALATQPKEARFLDLGCGDCCTLDFLAALGFTYLDGIDLQIKQPPNKHPYQLYEGDMTQTLLPDASYDVAVSISVIEHSVNLPRFFQETHRLLKPGGLLFVTTDYWEKKISVEDVIKPFDLSWSIFSKEEIEAAIALATNQGFQLEQVNEIPQCVDRPVSWYDKDYTFIALTFSKL